jgi:putative sterol carrier protein
MATVAECRAAIDELARRLDGVDATARAKHVPDRTIGVTLLDLDVTFLGRLHEGSLVDVVEADGPKPQVRLVMNSDDLVSLTTGDLHFAHAWASGRVRLDASLRDLLRLRAFM